MVQGSWNLARPVAFGRRDADGQHTNHRLLDAHLDLGVARGRSHLKGAHILAGVRYYWCVFEQVLLEPVAHHGHPKAGYSARTLRSRKDP